MTYVVSSSDGTLYGPFTDIDEAVKWAEENEEEYLGDWHIKEVYELGS